MPGKRLFRDERKQRGAVLRVMCLALMMVVGAVASLNVALPEIARSTGRLADAAAVDRGRIRARLRGAAPARRGDRRPDRPQARSRRRPRPLRPLLAGGHLREQPRRADRASRRHGRRRGDDHAGDAVRDHDRLPARGTRQGRRDVGRRRGGRRRARLARLGRDARVASVAVDLRPQRRPREPSRSSGRSRSCRPPARRGRPGSTSSARSSPPRRSRRSSSASSKGPSAAGASRRRSPHWRSASLGAVAFVLWELRRREPMLDPRHFARRGFAAGTLSDDRPVLRRLRLPLPGASVPPARDGLLAAPGGRRARADGARRHPALPQGSRDRGPARRSRRRRDGPVADGARLHRPLDARARLVLRALPRRAPALRRRHGPRRCAGDDRDRGVAAAEQAGCRLGRQRRLTRARRRARDRGPRQPDERRLPRRDGRLDREAFPPAPARRRRDRSPRPSRSASSSGRRAISSWCTRRRPSCTASRTVSSAVRRSCSSARSSSPSGRRAGPSPARTRPGSRSAHRGRRRLSDGGTGALANERAGAAKNNRHHHRGSG